MVESIMEINNQEYEMIRELILLGFFTKHSFFDKGRLFLGEYQCNDKKYKIHWSFIDEQEISIFIKCENESIQLILEEVKNYITENKDVYLHINKYKNVDFGDVLSLYWLKYINKKNIISTTKINVGYSRIDYMYENPNKVGEGYQEKRYIFRYPEHFDEKLKNKKCIEAFKDVFSAEIILNIINQVYPNFKQIDINNKIDKVINSLSPDELIVLKERLQQIEDEKGLTLQK